ncbi:SDR family oxidoreductase [Solihabitans fulvus]|uniref:SDR family oxidoreductase n=1 Tax=Solihabitans fulvus TaxID=1892852 RepID=A0A5B2WRF8_9PSEU|nr:SDR family oxidoreductase [Solihabitans fulvus]KAA2253574.1 SDR family oxidoreductase [Solihabitans fulvus]
MDSKRVAVITGAASGLGRAAAVRLTKDGYSVVIADIDDEAGRVADEIGGRAVKCDVSDVESVRALAGQLDRVDVLVNNAGVWHFAALDDTTPADFHRVMNVNVLGNLLCTQALVPLIAESGGGSVVNISSILAKVPRVRSGIYPAAKAAIVALTRQAALEYAPLGIRVNAVGPGMIHTEGADSLYGPSAEERERRGSYLPLGRLGVPDDITGAISFLVSPDARYMTGQILYVDGGLGDGTIRYLHQAQGIWAG